MGISAIRQLSMKPEVATFFYGSYINLAVLGEVDLAPNRVEVARLPGFDLEIRPLANLIPSDRDTVYGILAEATHDELARLYEHARDVLGGNYLPRAVLAHTLSGQVEPALCYIAPALEHARASRDYVSRILEPAREYGFPDWYLEKIESFAD
jgi:hypothetical protein